MTTSSEGNDVIRWQKQWVYGYKANRIKDGRKSGNQKGKRERESGASIDVCHTYSVRDTAREQGTQP